MPISSTLNVIHRHLGRSPLAVRLSVMIRNQCDAVIAYHLGATHSADENGELWLANRVAPHCQFFIDAGANTGRWTDLILGRASPSVRGLLIEPGRGALKQLRSRHGADPRLEIADLALGSAPGEAKFYEEGEGGESSSLIAEYVRDPGASYVVPISTIDREIASRHVGVVDLLKIDAEGYDARILRGAEQALSAHQVRAVQFEYGVNWLAAGDTLLNTTSWLRGFGYELWLLTHDGLREFDYERFGDFFRYSNFVALAPGARDAFQL